MRFPRRTWIRRLSITSLILLAGLEFIARTAPRLNVIRATATSELAFRAAALSFTFVTVDDPSGERMPFFSRDNYRSDLDERSASGHSRVEIPLLFYRDSATYRTKQGGWLTMSGVAVSYLPLALLAVIWPVILTWRLVVGTGGMIGRTWRRRRQLLFGESCPACGYDLRATTGRCPECGAAFERKTVIVPAGKARGDYY